MKVVLIGHYGMGNIGDDLMLRNLLHHFSADHSVEAVTVFCKNDYYQPFPKTHFIPSNLSGKLKKFLALYKADVVCWGGGTCIYERADNSGLHWLLKIQSVCARMKVPFAFMGIGIGTLTTNEIKNVALKLLNGARFVSFRDQESRAVARNILGFSGMCLNCGDLATVGWRTIAVNHRQKVWQGELSFSGVFGQSPELVAHWGGELAKLVTDLGVRVNFLPAHTREADDNRFHHQIAAYLKPGSYIIHSLATPFEFIPLLGRMDFHIGMRLHSVIIADMLGIANIAVEYSPKVAFYLHKSRASIVDRLVQPMGAIDSERVKRVYSTYKQPTEFLDAEEKSALESLKALLQPFRKA